MGKRKVCRRTEPETHPAKKKGQRKVCRRTEPETHPAKKGKREVCRRTEPETHLANMGERKVWRRTESVPEPHPIGLILPMSISCLTCQNNMRRGDGFHALRESVQGEDRQRYRLRFKCNKCSSEITFKKDPPNSDYTIEGATLFFDPSEKEREAVLMAQVRSSTISLEELLEDIMRKRQNSQGLVPE